MNHMQVQPTFLVDVMWTDETYFSGNGMYNRLYTHYWALENPKLFTDAQHQVFGIHVWCAIYSNKLIGPIFYDGILTGARYLQLMPNFLENLPVFYLRNACFQRDGAPAHKTSPVNQ